MTPGPGKYGDTSSWRTWAPAGPPASNWPPVLSEKFDQLMAASLSRNTWSSLKSVVSVVKQTAAEFEVDLDLPWGESKLMTFLVASSCRKLKSATCKSYIHRMSSVQQLNGGQPISLTPWAKKVLAGMRNLEEETPGRLAVTPAWLRVIYSKLRNSDWTRARRHLFWCVCCLLFHGSLRSCELLTTSTKSWTPGSTLMGADIVLRREKVNGKWARWLLLKIKLPKEEASSGRKAVFVEMLEQPELWFCPYASFTNYISVVHKKTIVPDLPAIRTEEGKGYPAIQFNSDLKELLRGLVPYSSAGSGILSHSFRAGVSTTLARLGFSEETISAQGRWSSTCYQRYVKLGRASKMTVQQEVASALADAASNRRDLVLVP